MATLCARHRLSRRQTAELLGELFGCPVSVGALDAILGRVGQALAQPYDELRAALPAAPVVYGDETGWALAGRRRWLWGGFTPTIAVFAISASRGQAAARELLGAQPAGIVCTDRWVGYNHLPNEQRQVCWAHLRRDFQALSERPLAADQRLGRALAGSPDFVEGVRALLVDRDNAPRWRHASLEDVDPAEVAELFTDGRRTAVATAGGGQRRPRPAEKAAAPPHGEDVE